MLAFVCVFSLVFGAAACGGNNGDNGGVDNGQNSEQTGGVEYNDAEQNKNEDGGNNGGESGGGTENEDDTENESGDGNEGSGNAGGETVHEHTLVKTDSKTSTCTEDGNIEYWTCSGCGRFFADSEGGIEISLASTVISASHTFSGSWTCTVCNHTLTESDGLEYTLSSDGKSYEVSGIGTCTDAEIVIPYTYENLPVTSVGEYAFYREESVTGAYIPDSVTTIGYDAFSFCTSLNKIYLGSGVTTIEMCAFSYCMTVESITVPDGTAAPGDGVFMCCTSLQRVNLPSGLTEIPNSLFQYCSALEIIDIPRGVTSVGINAFYNCTALKSLTLPDGVLTIGDQAFYACVSLKSLDLGGGVTTIGTDAFNSCASLDSIVIPASVTQLGNANYTRYNGYVFSQNFSLINIEVEAGNNSYKSIDGNLYSYDGTKLISYALGKTEHTFTVPDGVTEIGTSAFSCAASLQYIELPSSLKTIGYNAFAYSGLVSVNIPEGVTSLGDNAFYYCYSLVSLTIPSTVTGGLDGNASVYGLVDDCANLVEVYNLASSVNFGSDDIEMMENWQYIVDTYGGYFQIYSQNVYTSADVESVLITQGDYVFYKDGGNYYLAVYTGWDSEIVLPELTVDGKTVNYGISDYALSAGYYYYLESIYLDNYVSGSIIINSNMLNVKSIVISDCVTSVGNYAFAQNYLLESITLGSGITSIGNFAFVYCIALDCIAIPDAVTTIGYDAFEGVTAEIAWGDNPSITEIADGVFAYYQGTSITIPISVTSIGSMAFGRCENLTTITIPESVTYIGIDAFMDCTSLEKIIFANTSGWRVTVSETDTDGTEVDVTDSDLNATYMTGSYRQYYWYRSGN